MAEIVENLDDAAKKRARKELNEDPKNRDGAIETLAEWANQQKWLTTPTDKTFLLRFLRVKKFSQLEARKALEQYWRGRSAAPEWFKDRDPRDVTLQKTISQGAMLVLPKVDKDGKRCLLIRFGALDPALIKPELGGADGVFKAFLMVVDWITMDPRVQINGIKVIVDLSGYTLQHKMILHTSENMKKYVGIVQNNSMRMKGALMYNIPTIFEAVLAIMKPFMKQKLRDRIKTYGRSLVSLYDDIDMSVLPQEYLPDDYEKPCSGSIDEILANMKEELTKPDIVEYLKNLANPKYGVDLEYKPSETLVPSASFRKLNVD